MGNLRLASFFFPCVCEHERAVLPPGCASLVRICGGLGCNGRVNAFQVALELAGRQRAVPEWFAAIQQKQLAIEPAANQDLFFGPGQRLVVFGDLVVAIFVANCPVVAQGAVDLKAENIGQLDCLWNGTVEILRFERGLGELLVELGHEAVLKQLVGGLYGLDAGQRKFGHEPVPTRFPGSKSIASFATSTGALWPSRFRNFMTRNAGSKDLQSELLAHSALALESCDRREQDMRQAIQSRIDSDQKRLDRDEIRTNDLQDLKASSRNC